MNKIEVKENKVPLTVGIIEIVTFGTIILAFVCQAIEEKDNVLMLITFLCFGPFILLGLYMILDYWKRRLILDGSMVCYVSVIKRKKHFYLNDIDKVKLFQKGTNVQYRIYGIDGEFLASFEGSMIHSEQLIERLVQEGIPFEEIMETGHAKEYEYLTSKYQKDDMKRKRKRLRILNVLLLLMMSVVFIWFRSRIFIGAMMVLGLNWVLYLWFYPAMSFDIRTSEKSLRLPMLWLPGFLAMLILLTVTDTVYIVNDGQYVWNILWIELLLVLTFLLTAKVKMVPVKKSKICLVMLAALVLAFTICIPIHYIMTFDRPIHENVLVIDRWRESSSKRRDYYLKVQTVDGFVYNFSVSSDMYDKNATSNTVRICKRKSFFGFEYWMLHE